MLRVSAFGGKKILVLLKTLVSGAMREMYFGKLIFMRLWSSASFASEVPRGFSFLSGLRCDSCDVGPQIRHYSR